MTASSPSPLPALAIAREFGDVDELSAVLARRQEMQLVQLGQHPLQASLLYAEFGEIVCFCLRTSIRLRVYGGKPSGYIPLALLLDQTELLLSHGTPIEEHMLFGFDACRETNVVMPSQVRLAVVYVRENVFLEWADRLQRPDLNRRFLTENVSPLAEFSEIREYLQQLFHLVEHQRPWLQQPHASQLTIDDLLPLLIASIPVQTRQTSRPRPLRRAKLVWQAETYALEHPDRPLTLRDLCAATGTSSRALSYGFRDVFGMSPMAYLKTCRLHGVRRALKTTDNPETTTVSAVANCWGFWSLGHFARDYKLLFGESPSATLERSH